MATKTISVEQRFELLAKLAARVDWSSLDPGAIQQVIDQPGDSGRQFTLFLKNGCQVLIGAKKIIAEPFDPARSFGGAKFTVVADEQDRRNDDLTEIDFEKADFLNMLSQAESSITGEEKLGRLKKIKRTRYGATAFMGLWQNYRVWKESSALETLYHTKHIGYVDFFGDVLLNSFGKRCVLCLIRNSTNGKWERSYTLLEDEWRSGVWTMVSAEEKT